MRRIDRNDARRGADGSKVKTGDLAMRAGRQTEGKVQCPRRQGHVIDVAGLTRHMQGRTVMGKWQAGGHGLAFGVAAGRRAGGAGPRAGCGVAALCGAGVGCRWFEPSEVLAGRACDVVCKVVMAGPFVPCEGEWSGEPDRARHCA